MSFLFSGDPAPCRFFLCVLCALCANRLFERLGTPDFAVHRGVTNGTPRYAFRVLSLPGQRIQKRIAPGNAGL